MKCTSKTIYQYLSVIGIAVLLLGNLTACGAKQYSFAYDRNRNNTSYSVASNIEGNTLDPFAKSLCVATQDVTEGTDVDMSADAAGLFDIDSGKVIYAKNIHEQMNPASLTKVLTALCALKYGNLDDVITATENVYVTESGAVKFGVQAGDTMTMEQALYVLMLRSANDVANMIAEHIGGSVEGFVNLMNETAASLGATNSHFANPHGLTDPEHYTTAYDLYLILNEAVKYDKFLDLIQTPTYISTYRDKDGNEKKIDLANSNAYLKGEAIAPENVTVVGGKTGTTSAAGNCLILYCRNASGNPFISVVLKALDRTVLYTEMTDLLGEIKKSVAKCKYLSERLRIVLQFTLTPVFISL